MSTSDDAARASSTGVCIGGVCVPGMASAPPKALISGRRSSTAKKSTWIRPFPIFVTGTMGAIYVYYEAWSVCACDCACARFWRFWVQVLVEAMEARSLPVVGRMCSWRWAHPRARPQCSECRSPLQARTCHMPHQAR